jgi:putative membrane protein
MTHLGAALCVGAALGSHAADAAALDDAQILGIYIQVNGFDIETALLGRGLGYSVGVRKIAEHVATDHLAVRQLAYDIAATCNVRPALPESRAQAGIEHGQAMVRLVKLKGREFDEAYLSHEVVFHKDAIAAVRDVLAPAAHCPALKGHLNGVLPAFESHLAQTAKLAGALPR